MKRIELPIKKVNAPGGRKWVREQMRAAGISLNKYKWSGSGDTLVIEG